MKLKNICFLMVFIVLSLSRMNFADNLELKLNFQQKQVCFLQDCTWSPNKKIELQQFHLIQHNLNIIDVRNPTQLKEGMISGTISFYFCKSFGKWIKKLIDFQSPLVIYGNNLQNITQVINFLHKIGYTKVLGYSTFSISDWKNFDLPYFIPIFVDTVFIDKRTILDVRTKEQQMKGVANSQNIIFYELQNLLSMQMNHSKKKIQKSQRFVIHCHSGFRAMIAYSFLINLGYDVVVFPFGFEKIQSIRIPNLSELYDKTY